MVKALLRSVVTHTHTQTHTQATCTSSKPAGMVKVRVVGAFGFARHGPLQTTLLIHGWKGRNNKRRAGHWVRSRCTTVGRGSLAMIDSVLRSLCAYDTDSPHPTRKHTRTNTPTNTRAAPDRIGRLVEEGALLAGPLGLLQVLSRGGDKGTRGFVSCESVPGAVSGLRGFIQKAM